MLSTPDVVVQACDMILGRPLWRAIAWRERSASLCSGAGRMTVSGGRHLPLSNMPLVENVNSLTMAQKDSEAGEMHCRYEIYAISRPATLLALASYPLTRYYQRRFREESIAAVRDAVATS